jgi:hypothetical protein
VRASKHEPSSEAVIAAFDKLPPNEREEVVAELLRRVARSDHEGPSDDGLVAAADDVFVALDRRESTNR